MGYYICLAASNVTIHPSTASVHHCIAIMMVRCSEVLMWRLKGYTFCRKMRWLYATVMSFCLSVCLSVCSFVGLSPVKFIRNVAAPGSERGVFVSSPINFINDFLLVRSCNDSSILYRFFSYLTLKNIGTLKSGLEVAQDHSDWYQSKAWVQFPTHLP